MGFGMGLIWEQFRILQLKTETKRRYRKTEIRLVNTKSETVFDQNTSIIPWTFWALCPTGTIWNTCWKVEFSRKYFHEKGEPEISKSEESTNSQSSRCLPKHFPIQFLLFLQVFHLFLWILYSNQTQNQQKQLKLSVQKVFVPNGWCWLTIRVELVVVANTIGDELVASAVGWWWCNHAYWNFTTRSGRD